jgi:BirA family biotin operon repressor/biotin-[acetyl-CoA-carboxylase] ligase
LQNNTFSTLFVGQNLIRLSAVDSTNDFLKLMLSNSEPVSEGTVIMADHQFAGRGQQQNRWHAQPGLNLTFSILLNPSFLAIENQFMLNMAVSVGICKALTTFVPEGISIKWPNDLYFLDQKLGGVLIENGIGGKVINYSIIGIGINVNQLDFQELGTVAATSIGKILQQPVNLLTVLSRICSCIEAEYLKLRAGAYEHLREKYHDSVFRIGVPAMYKDVDGIFQAEIEGVEDSGVLVISRSGQRRLYRFKEIEFLSQGPEIDRR